MVRGEGNTYVKYSGEYGIDGIQTAREPYTGVLRRAAFTKDGMLDKELKPFHNIMERAGGWLPMPTGDYTNKTFSKDLLTKYFIENGNGAVEASGFIGGCPTAVIDTDPTVYYTSDQNYTTELEYISYSVGANADVTGIYIHNEGNIGVWAIEYFNGDEGWVEIDEINLNGDMNQLFTIPGNHANHLTYRLKGKSGTITNDSKIYLATLVGNFGAVNVIPEPPSSAVQEILDGKQTKSNLVTEIRAPGFNSDSKYPSQEAVAKALEDYQLKNKLVLTIPSVADSSDEEYPSQKAVATGLSGKQTKSNLVTTIPAVPADASNTKYPSQKAISTLMTGYLPTTYVPKISGVEIDADKDWDQKSITNIKKLVVDRGGKDQLILENNRLSAVSEYGTFMFNAYDGEAKGEIVMQDAAGADVVAPLLAGADKWSINGKHLVTYSGGKLYDSNNTLLDLPKPAYLNIILHRSTYSYGDYIGYGDGDGRTKIGFYTTVLPIDNDAGKVLFQDVHADGGYNKNIEEKNANVESAVDDADGNPITYPTRAFQVPITGKYEIEMGITITFKNSDRNDWFGCGLVEEAGIQKKGDGSKSLTFVVARHYNKADTMDGTSVSIAFKSKITTTLDKDTWYYPAVQSLNVGFLNNWSLSVVKINEG